MVISRGLPTSIVLHNWVPIFCVDLSFFYYELFLVGEQFQAPAFQMEVEKSISSLLPFLFIAQGLIKESLSLVFGFEISDKRTKETVVNYLLQQEKQHTGQTVSATDKLPWIPLGLVKYP